MFGRCLSRAFGVQQVLVLGPFEHLEFSRVSGCHPSKGESFALAQNFDGSFFFSLTATTIEQIYLSAPIWPRYNSSLMALV